jgi:hypothetical protein
MCTSEHGGTAADCRPGLLFFLSELCPGLLDCCGGLPIHPSHGDRLDEWTHRVVVATVRVVHSARGGARVSHLSNRAVGQGMRPQSRLSR